MSGRNRFLFSPAATEMLAAATIAAALFGPAMAVEAPSSQVPDPAQEQLGSIMPLESVEGISKLLPLLLTSPERRQIAAEIEASIRQGNMEAAKARLHAAVEMGTLAIVLVDRLNDPGLLPTLQSLGISGDGSSQPQACSIDAAPSEPDLQQLRAMLQHEQEQRSTLAQELAALQENRAADAQAQTAELQKALMEAQEQGSNAERQFAAIQEEHRSLLNLREGELAATRSRIAELEDHLRRERERVDASAQELAAAQRELRALQALKEEAASEALRVSELEAALAREKVRGDAVTRELADALEEASHREQNPASVFLAAAIDGQDSDGEVSESRFPLMPQLLAAVEKDTPRTVSDPLVTSAVPARTLASAEKGHLLNASLPAAPPKAAPEPDKGADKASLPAPRADDRLVARADELFRKGDVSGARLLLERSMEAGNPRAALLLAETFDPHVLSQMGTLGLRGDTAKARMLYEKALALGSDKAAARMEALK